MCSNYADLFLPALSKDADAEGAPVLILMTKEELALLTHKASHDKILPSCTLVYENRNNRMWMHSFVDLQKAIKDAIDSREWHLRWGDFIAFN